MKITQNEFKKLITAMRSQIDFDREKAELLSNIYGADVMPSDNSRLTNAIFDFLHTQFPPQEGFCAIQTFCFELDFGRSVETDGDPIDELWGELEKSIPVKCELVQCACNKKRKN